MYGLMSFLIKSIVVLSYRFKDGNRKLNDALLKRDLVIHPKNYYVPFVAAEDLSRPLDEERNIPGLSIDLERQRTFLEQLDYAGELLEIPDEKGGDLQYAYRCGFGPGDAEILYGLIRHLKPRRLIEVGAGNSTLIAQQAIQKNKSEDAHYECSHLCIEPYENDWLEQLDVEVLREKVEDVPLARFQALSTGDILFVDSSHVVRPQGDVLFEVFDIYGTISAGVYVHVHDIFTPRDYPRDWVIDRRRLWHEQYLLEAFLSFNQEFEVVCALNWLWHNHPDLLSTACPVLSSRLPNNPGSFWFRRREVPAS